MGKVQKATRWKLSRFNCNLFQRHQRARPVYNKSKNSQLCTCSRILNTPGSQSLKAARSHGLTTLGLAVAKSRCIEGLKIFSSVQGLKVPGYQGVKVSGSQGLMSQAIRFKFKGLMMSWFQGLKVSRSQGIRVQVSKIPRCQISQGQVLRY